MTSQSPFLAPCLGKSELGKSVIIGSICECCSNITMKHHVMPINYGKECVDADKSKHLNIPVP